jgi:hypothetical protein
MEVSAAKAMLESLVRTAIQVGLPLLGVYLADKLDLLNSTLGQNTLWVTVGAPVLAALMRKFFPTITDAPNVGRTDVPAKAV